MSAVGVSVSPILSQRIGAGPTPSTALRSLMLRPIPFIVAKKILEQNHYLHSLPGGTQLSMGVFGGNSLRGVLTFGAGPALAYSLVRGACLTDWLTLTDLPPIVIPVVTSLS